MLISFSKYRSVKDQPIKTNWDKEILNKIAQLNLKESDAKTTTEIREQYQYGTELSIKDDLYLELLNLAKEVISKTKVMIEG